MLNISTAFNRIAPLLIRNLLSNNRNPDAIEAQKEARAARARPLFQQSAKPPELHGDTGELKDKNAAGLIPQIAQAASGDVVGAYTDSLKELFSRAFNSAGMVARYDLQSGGGGRWEESKHPRASDGRFGSKAGQHGGGDQPGGKKQTPQDPAQPAKQTAPPAASQSKDAPAAAPEPKKDGSQTDEPTTPPPPGGFAPDPTKVNPQTGYTDAARVGVPGMQSPPPPSKIPRLPNLTPDERRAEHNFASAFEADPDGVADNYMRQVMSGAIGDGPNIFATDDAKLLSGDWNPQGVSKEESFAAKALYNTAVHQTANAVAKRAFTRYLDEVVSKLPEDRKFCLVTAGGVASGKGYAISNVGEVNSLQSTAGVVWDSAGEQNSTELPWLEAECKKRGIGMVAAYIHATPDITWPRAVSRANQKGRMVDARVFADSYAIGAQNFEAFQKQHANNPNVKAFVLDNTGEAPKMLPGVPATAKMNPDKTYDWAMKYIDTAPDIKPEIKRAATAGQRIWPAQQQQQQSATKPGVPGQQQSLPGTSTGGQQSLFNVARPAAAGRKAPAAAAPAQSLLSQATPEQRRVLAGKDTLSPADLAVKPQPPSKAGQKALFSRQRSQRSGLAAQLAEAFAEAGM